jgi:hypothetical protein
MGEMTKYIAIIETSHGNFRYDHLQESRESREDAKFLVVEAKACGGREVPSFHDTRRNKDFGMFLMDDFETSGTLQVA